MFSQDGYSAAGAAQRWWKNRFRPIAKPQVERPRGAGIERHVKARFPGYQRPLARFPQTGNPLQSALPVLKTNTAQPTPFSRAPGSKNSRAKAYGYRKRCYAETECSCSAKAGSKPQGSAALGNAGAPLGS